MNENNPFSDAQFHSQQDWYDNGYMYWSGETARKLLPFTQFQENSMFSLLFIAYFVDNLIAVF